MAKEILGAKHVGNELFLKHFNNPDLSNEQMAKAIAEELNMELPETGAWTFVGVKLRSAVIQSFVSVEREGGMKGAPKSIAESRLSANARKLKEAGGAGTEAGKALVAPPKADEPSSSKSDKSEKAEKAEKADKSDSKSDSKLAKGNLVHFRFEARIFNQAQYDAFNGEGETEEEARKQAVGFFAVEMANHDTSKFGLKDATTGAYVKPKELQNGARVLVIKQPTAGR